MAWRSPKVEGSDEEHENTQTKHGYKGGDGPFLKFKNSMEY